MSFWSSTTPQARKEHICIYCHKKIVVGEIYHRETGIWEGDFQNFCLCQRCSYLADKFDRGEELSDLHESLFGNGLIRCPACDSANLHYYEMSEDKMSCECECGECEEKWEADLSLSGVKEIVSRHNGEA